MHGEHRMSMENVRTSILPALRLELSFNCCLTHNPCRTLRLAFSGRWRSLSPFPNCIDQSKKGSKLEI